MSAQNKILVILTGGTICSSKNQKGERYADAENVQIIEHFQSSNSPFSKSVSFDALIPTNILSENMTVNTWNTLLDSLRREVDWTGYRGIIMRHGTDTLAYTSSLLALTLAGTPIPVCIVSAQQPLYRSDTNGYANFRASVELIMNGIAPNVYVVYRNMDGRMYVHYGAHLLQCANYSNDFFSYDAMEVQNTENAYLCGKAYETNASILTRMKPLGASVLYILPYVGLDYEKISLEGVEAVVHGTYHSDSVCVERSGGEGSVSGFSILTLIERCKRANIPLMLAPCNREAYRYESTGDALRSVAYAAEGMTVEMSYVKTLVGCALGYQGTDLVRFVERSVNFEVR